MLNEFITSQISRAGRDHHPAIVLRSIRPVDPPLTLAPSRCAVHLTINHHGHKARRPGASNTATI